MNNFLLNALSPLDGKYRENLVDLRELFSELGLMKCRVQVELNWFITLASHEGISELPQLSVHARQFLQSIENEFDISAGLKIKQLEYETQHDVKAIEYFLKDAFSQSSELSPYREFLHFACTSEDINNIAYGLLIKQARDALLVPMWTKLNQRLQTLAATSQHISMLSRTHGQPASPTTLGKEIVNVCFRLQRQLEQLQTTVILGKFNGAVGNYNAHLAAYPAVDWPALSKSFVESFGLQWNPYTTQIEPHDYLAELFGVIVRYNTILLDFCKDIWGYISLGYFEQHRLDGEVGSSTMPHKVNPICFENAEGNLGLSTALLQHMSTKLPQSRFQRDLSDSTVLRNLGVSLGYSLLAYQSVFSGLNRIEVNATAMADDLDSRWELLSEALQTVMRRYQVETPYEKLKTLTQGVSITKAELDRFIRSLPIPDVEKERLKQLTPSSYTGAASGLVGLFLN